MYVFLRGKAEHPEYEVIKSECAVVVNEEEGEDGGMKEGKRNEVIIKGSNLEDRRKREEVG